MKDLYLKQLRVTHQKKQLEIARPNLIADVGGSRLYVCTFYLLFCLHIPIFKFQ